MTPARLTRQAERELYAAVRWLSAESPAAARELRNAVNKQLLRVAEFPESGPERPDLNRQGWRFFDLLAFPYVLVVDPAETPLAVLHILHTSRDMRALLGG
jgi:toxin ParE1/3/4